MSGFVWLRIQMGQNYLSTIKYSSTIYKESSQIRYKYQKYLTACVNKNSFHHLNSEFIMKFVWGGGV